MGEEILNNFLVKSTPMWMSNGLWSWCLLGAIFRFRTRDGLDVESDASRAEAEFDGSVNLDDQNEYNAGFSGRGLENPALELFIQFCSITVPERRRDAYIRLHLG